MDNQQMVLEVKLFAFLVVVNAAPIVAQYLLPNLRTPIDGGRSAKDHRRWLGHSKTWRGLFSGLVAGVITSWLLGFPPLHGLMLAGLSLAGDLITSFIKRRLDFKPSSQAPILDQFFEVTLPLALAQHLYALSTLGATGVFGAFVVFNWGISPLLFRIGLRRRPY